MIFGIDRRDSDRAIFDAAASTWLGYAELARLMSDASVRLRSPEKRLLFVFCRNNMRSVLDYLGGVESGNAVALLDDSLAEESKKELIALYRPELISTDREVPAPGYRRLEESLWQRESPEPSAIHPSLSLMLSTSGSTGSPRFVRLTTRNVEANADSIAQALGISSADRAITTLPIHYSYGLSVLNSHLLAGASVVLTANGLMEPAFWNVFREQNCTSFAGVPYLYQMLNRLNPDKLNIPSLNTMTQAGGSLDKTLIAKFSSWIAERGGRFFVMYGQTEATARISILPSGELPARLGSVGLPIQGGSAVIDDGELVYTGPNVMLGYAASHEDLALGDVNHGVLRTGDLATIDKDGFLFIAGRAKRDAKLFGLRINLDEIESLLKPHGPVGVVSRGDSLRIYCEWGDAEAFAELKRELAARLKINHAAFVFERLDKLPVSPSGKIDYQALSNLP